LSNYEYSEKTKQPETEEESNEEEEKDERLKKFGKKIE